MEPRMKEFKNLHTVKKIKGKNVIQVKKGKEARAKELWTEMYHPINKLVYHVIKKSCRSQLQNKELVIELHLRARETIIKYIKPGKSGSNSISYMYSSLRCGLMDYLRGYGKHKNNRSIYNISASRRGEKFERRFICLGDEIKEFQDISAPSWLDQIDFKVLSEYIPDVECARLSKELAYVILECMNEIFNGPVKLKGNNLIFGMYEMVRSRVDVTVTSEDLKLARAVIQEAYSYYREDEMDFYHGEIYGNMGAITSADED